MTELTQAITNSKISIRWAEEYVSRGSNRQMSIAPPGLYDGGVVDYSTTTTLRIAAGTYVLRDVSNGYGLVLRDTDAATIDCSSLFPAASTKTWYVGVRATYTTGSDTTCEYYITDVAPSTEHFVGKDALITTTVTINASDTGLDQSTFTVLSGAKPTAYPLRSSEGAVLSTDREFGFVNNVQAYGIPSPDERDALEGYPSSSSPDAANPFLTKAYLSGDASVNDYQSVTISSNVKFQLSGDIYVGKGTTSASVRPWFRLLSSVYDTSPYELSDGSLVTVDYLKTSSDATTIVPSTHADADGFYSNPWVYLTSSGGAIPNSTIACLCTQKITIEDGPDELASVALASSNISPHAEVTKMKAAGTDTAEPYDRWTIDAGTLQDALEAILAGLNQTQVDLRSFASSSDFKRIFRGGTVAADSGIGAGTPSVYVSRGCWVAVTGAHINSSGVITSSPVEGTDVAIFGIKSDGVFFAFKDNVTTGSSLGTVDSIDGTTSATWDCSYASIGPDGRHQFWGDLRIDGTVFTDDEVGITVNSGAGELSAPESERVWVTNNATYYPSSDTFNRASSAHGSVGAKFDPYVDTVNGGTTLAVCSSVGSSSWAENSWFPFGGFCHIREVSAGAGAAGAVFLDGGDLTIADDGAAAFLDMQGIMMLHCSASSEMAIYVIDRDASTVALLYGNTSFWSTTYNEAGRVSLGYPSNLLSISNKTGSSKVLNIGCIEVASRSTCPLPS